MPDNETSQGGMLRGASTKFAESFGSGLAYGIVVLIGVFAVKFWVSSAGQIVRLTDPVQVCGRDGGGNNCQVFVPCDKDEIVIGGECSVSKIYQGDFWLHNFGPYNVNDDKDDLTPRKFQCNWGGDAANPKSGTDQKMMIPHARAACVKKSLFIITLPSAKD